LDRYSGLLMMELRSRYFKHTGESKENLKMLLKTITEQKTAKCEKSAVTTPID
jgi:hypothetical protein